jgi:hypothetical protein
MSLPNIVFNNQNLSSVKEWSPWWSPTYPEICKINSGQSLTCGYLDDRTLSDMDGDGMLESGNDLVSPPITPYDSFLFNSSFDFGQSVPRFCNSQYDGGIYGIYNRINCGIDIWTDTTPILSGTFQQVQN